MNSSKILRMNSSKNKPVLNIKITKSAISLVLMGIALVAPCSLLLPSFNQVATAQLLILNPVVVPTNNLLSSSLLPNIINSNNQLAALTQFSTPSTTVFPFTPTTNAAVIAAANPFVLSSINQNPFIQGSSTNGFVSFLCASNGLQTPSSSDLSFQVSSPTTNRLNTILTTTATTSTTAATLIPLTGSFTLSNSLGVPSIAGQINTARVTGNAFILQGTLTSSTANTLLSGGLSNFCSANTITSLLPVSNDFTITGICGTNVPLAFAIDRVVVGAFTANVACNNIV
jgi:hypothetical protein